MKQPFGDLASATTRRRAALVGAHLLGFFLPGCKDSTAADTSLTGTYVGEFADTRVGVTPAGTLQLNHSGTRVSGTISAGRVGSLEAVVDMVEGELTGTITFTGTCPGTADTNANVAEIDRIDGSFEGTDCMGSFYGTFQVVRQP
jgi:hypothetical protein